MSRVQHHCSERWLLWLQNADFTLFLLDNCFCPPYLWYILMWHPSGFLVWIFWSASLFLDDWFREEIISLFRSVYILWPMHALLLITKNYLYMLMFWIPLISWYHSLTFAFHFCIASWVKLMYVLLIIKAYLFVFMISISFIFWPHYSTSVFHAYTSSHICFIPLLYIRLNPWQFFPVSSPVQESIFVIPWTSILYF